MVAIREDDLKGDILASLEARLEGGQTLDQAVAGVHLAILSEGQSDRFVREFGSQAIRDMWRCSNRVSRGIAISGGVRRHDLRAMTEDESLFEALYKIGDTWVRLGDCTRGMCEAAAGFFKGQAYGNMREAYMFERLAAKLRGAQTVRARFTEDGVWAILQEFKLE